MILLYTLLLIAGWTFEGGECSYNHLNKTKRTPSQHLFNYGETRPILIYSDTTVPVVSLNDDYANLKPTPATQLELFRSVKYPQHISQQMTYDTPSMPNGYINQFVQRPINKDIQTGHYREQTLQPVIGSHNFVPAETAVLPVELRNIITNEQSGYPGANIRYNIDPLKKTKYNYEVVNSPQNTPYQSPVVNQFQYQPQVHTIPLLPTQFNAYYQKTQNVPIVNYIKRNHSPPRHNLNVPKYIHAPAHNINNLPDRKPLPVTPKSPLKKNEVTEINNDKQEISTDGDSESEEKLTNQNEDNERESESRKHSYDFEESDHFEYKDDKDSAEEDNERDNRRGSSTHRSSKKVPNKQSKKDSGRDYYRFPSSGHSDYKSSKKNNKTPKMLYKSIKFSKETDESDDDSIEGRHSENIPVTRKHRLFREKWYITKNMDDTEKE